MKLFAFKLCLLLILTLALSRPSAAQWVPPPPPHLESVDLVAVKSATIVVGRLLEYESTDTPDRKRNVTISVQEVLKGRPGKTIRVQLARSDREFDLWKNEPSRLLVALPTTDEPPTLIDLSEPGLMVMTAELKPLRTADEVIRALKERIRTSPENAKVKRFGRSLPIEKVRGTKFDVQPRYHNKVFVDVPVDKRLERYGHQALRQPKSDERIEGLQALSHFRSEANVQRVQEMLKDGTGWRTLYEEDGDLFRRYRTNDVRRQADDVLQGWEVRVDRSVENDPIDVGERVVTATLDSGTITEDDVRGLIQYRRLENLYLSNAKLSHEGWSQVEKLRSVQSLVLDGSNLEDADLKSLARLPNLAYLSIENTAISDEGLQTLAQAEHLARVDVDGRISAAAIEKLRQRRPDLLVRADPFAFLGHLGPKRVDMRVRQVIFMYPPGQVPRPEEAGMRCYALIFSRQAASQVDALLRKVLPPDGWGIGYSDFTDRGSGYHRDATTLLGKRKIRQIDGVFLNTDLSVAQPMYGAVSAKPGERMIVVWSLAPR